ncbi:MAG: hypothetical protein R3B90_02405 [Planctomycetaceae bacterium]
MSATILPPSEVVVPVAAMVRGGWLYRRNFDLLLIAGTAGLGVVAGGAVVLRPEWFPTLLILDLWLLGYHHVIATFTRLSFDRKSFQEHRFLVLGLPVIVFAATLGVCLLWGEWAIATTYFVWQWFHYSRQSYGVARAYRRQSGNGVGVNDSALTAVIYGLPLAGIAFRCFQQPEYFLTMPIKLPIISGEVVVAALAFAIGGLIWWAVTQVREWRSGRWSAPLNLYLASHCLIYYVGYLAITDINYGWLAINVWHNAQYLLFVWMFNVRRVAREGKQAGLLEVLCRPGWRHVMLYFVTTMLLTTIVYGLTWMLLRTSLLAAIPAASLIVYQAINFQHYIVDGIIWKSNRQRGDAARGAGGTQPEDQHRPLIPEAVHD